jgi:hypothetical protein
MWHSIVRIERNFFAVFAYLISERNRLIAPITSDWIWDVDRLSLSAPMPLARQRISRAPAPLVTIVVLYFFPENFRRTIFAFGHFSARQPPWAMARACFDFIEDTLQRLVICLACVTLQRKSALVLPTYPDADQLLIRIHFYLSRHIVKQAS